MDRIARSRKDEDVQMIVRETLIDFLNEWRITDSNGDEYFNRKQASDFIGVSEPTFDKLKKEGHILAVQIGSITRYRKSDLLNIGREADQK